MAQLPPNDRRPNPHNNDSQTNQGWGWVSKASLLAAVAGISYYGYRQYRKQTSHNDDDEIEDETITSGGYKITPLGPEYLNETKGGPNTQGGTAGGTGAGNDDNDRDAYLGPMLKERRITGVLQNAHLHHGNTEFYFHLGIDSKSGLMTQFSQIKWVLIVRSKNDVKQIARRLLKEFPQFGAAFDTTQEWMDDDNLDEFGIESEDDTNFGLPKPLGDTSRFYMLRLGPIIIVSCGIGASSLSILLQEITKLLVDAGAFDATRDNQSLKFNTSYVEYILLMTAPGISTSPSKFMHQRRKSFDNFNLDDMNVSYKNKNNNLNNSGSMTRHRRGSYGAALDGSNSSLNSNSSLHRRSNSSISGNNLQNNTDNNKNNNNGLASLRVDLTQDKQRRERESQIIELRDSMSSMHRAKSAGTHSHPSTPSNNNNSNQRSNSQFRPSFVTNGDIPVILPTICLNEELLSYRRIIACGSTKHRKMQFDKNLVQDIKLRCAFSKVKPSVGKGLTVQHLNEAMSFKSMAIEHDSSTKTRFYNSCISAGVKYVDMESGYFASFCYKLNISCCAIIGIEYDILEMSNKSGAMRVTHSDALNATLDVFCQYLYDRLQIDAKNASMQLRNVQSAKEYNNNRGAKTPEANAFQFNRAQSFDSSGDRYDNNNVINNKGNNKYDDNMDDDGRSVRSTHSANFDNHSVGNQEFKANEDNNFGYPNMDQNIYMKNTNQLQAPPHMGYQPPMTQHPNQQYMAPSQQQQHMQQYQQPYQQPYHGPPTYPQSGAINNQQAGYYQQTQQLPPPTYQYQAQTHQPPPNQYNQYNQYPQSQQHAPHAQNYANIPQGYQNSNYPAQYIAQSQQQSMHSQQYHSMPQQHGMLPDTHMGAVSVNGESRLKFASQPQQSAHHASTSYPNYAISEMSYHSQAPSLPPSMPVQAQQQYQLPPQQQVQAALRVQQYGQQPQAQKQQQQQQQQQPQAPQSNDTYLNVNIAPADMDNNFNDNGDSSEHPGTEDFAAIASAAAAAAADGKDTFEQDVNSSGSTSRVEGESKKYNARQQDDSNFQNEDVDSKNEIL